MNKRLFEYQKLIETFIEAEYQFVPFIESPPEYGAILLRHDIDFDVQLAKELSFIEDQLEVKSTYFFMVRSASYNLFETENAKSVFAIKESGHNISLHFDPTIYEDFRKGLVTELVLFQKSFGIIPECISIHRPTDYFLKYDSPLNNTRHTYQSSYQREIKYFSDSEGRFRYGHPLNSAEFAKRRSIHLLIHPIWWVTNETDPVSILDCLLNNRIIRFQHHIAANCKPYRTVISEEYR